MNNYFNLVDQDYIREVDLMSKDPRIQEPFKLAYLILFFHNSNEDKDGRYLLLGDLFISLLNQHPLSRDRELLKKIIKKGTVRQNCPHTISISPQVFPASYCDPYHKILNTLLHIFLVPVL